MGILQLTHLIKDRSGPYNIIFHLGVLIDITMKGRAFRCPPIFPYHLRVYYEYLRENKTLTDDSDVEPKWL